MTVTKMNAGEYLVQAGATFYVVSHGRGNAKGNPWSVYIVNEQRRAAGKSCLLHEAWSKREAIAWIERQCHCMTEDPGDGFGERVVEHASTCPQHPEYEEES